MYCYFAIVFCSVVYFQLEMVASHGMIMDPVNRNSAWRKGFKTRPDYDDMSHMCGFSSYNNPTIPATCEPCGVRRFYKEGPIVKTYSTGSEITIDMRLTANHKGWATFKICPEKVVSEACFDKYPVTILNSPHQAPALQEIRYDWTDTVNGIKTIKARLPAGLKCDACVMQWHWQTNNQAGGRSEIWRQCSDIAIKDGPVSYTKRTVIVPVPPMTPEMLEAVGYKP